MEPTSSRALDIFDVLPNEEDKISSLTLADTALNIVAKTAVVGAIGIAAWTRPVSTTMGVLSAAGLWACGDNKSDKKLVYKSREAYIAHQVISAFSVGLASYGVTSPPFTKFGIVGSAYESYLGVVAGFFGVAHFMYFNCYKTSDNANEK